MLFLQINSHQYSKMIITIKDAIIKGCRQILHKKKKNIWGK